MSASESSWPLLASVAAEQLRLPLLAIALRSTLLTTRQVHEMSSRFGAKSTADEVLAGVDLKGTREQMVGVT